MNYRAELYDINNLTREAILDLLYTARVTEYLAGEHTLSLELSPYNSKGEIVLATYPDGPAHLPRLMKRKYIRLSGPDGTKSYMIDSIQINHDENSKVSFSLTCYHKKYALGDQVIPIVADYAQISSQELLNTCMAYVTGFSIGTNGIPSTTYRDISLEQPTALELINMICEQYSGTTKYYYKVNESGVIDILSESAMGSGKKFGLVYGGNTKAISRSDPQTGFVNRLYARGDLGNTLKLADNNQYYDLHGSVAVAEGVSTDLVLNNGGGDSDPVKPRSYLSFQFSCYLFWSVAAGYGNMNYTVTLKDASDNVVWGPQQFISPDIASSLYGNTVYPWLNIYTGDLAVIKKITIKFDSFAAYDGGTIFGGTLQIYQAWYELGQSVDYVEDGPSQTAYGEVEQSIALDYPACINKVRMFTRVGATVPGIADGIDSTFSGTYTHRYIWGSDHGYFHLAWTVSGKIPSSGIIGAANTDRAYIKHGSKSQHVTCTDIGGVMESYYIPGFVKELPYFAIFNIYIVTGQFRIYIMDEYGVTLFEHTTSGVGWLEIRNEDPFGPSNNGMIKIYIETLSIDSEFYLDSIQIAQSYEPVPFFKANSADELYIEAQRILQKNKLPLYTYEINFMELERSALDETYSVGDKIMVIDPELNLSSLLRIVKIDRNLLDDRDIQIQLATRNTPLASLINLISGNKRTLLT